MRFHPYLFAGIGARPWLTYRVHEESAIVEGWFRGPFTIPLRNAHIKSEPSVKYKLGFGSIEITTEAGVTQLWKRVPNIGRVEKELIRVSKGGAETRHQGRSESNAPSPWDRLRVPGAQTLQAYGYEYYICVFTGSLKRKESIGEERGASIFVGDDGREERIAIVSKKINDNELHSSLRLGDRLSMALFVRDDGLPHAYFMLFDHARRKEYLFLDEALFDLGWSKAPDYGNQWNWFFWAAAILVGGSLLIDGWQSWKAILVGLAAGGLAYAIPLTILERKLRAFGESAQFAQVRQFVLRQ